MKLVEIKHLNKSYTLSGKEKIPVLRDVNVSFESGEFVSILGESGSGKSTLMNIIGGMDSDYEGDLIIQGQTLRSMNEREVDAYRKDKIGFIFQSFNLIPHLTVLENVTIAMQMMAKSEKERTKRALDILGEVGLQDHVKKRPNQLSGGQKQRVAIARALANDPDIILADEPTGALDQETSEQILEILNSIAKKGVLIITVTHSEKVAQFGSRIVSVDDGRIKDDQTSRERYTAPRETKQKKGKSLSMAASFKMALRNMQLKGKRNALVAIGGSIGIISVLLMLALGNGVTGYMNDEINESINPLLVDVVKETESAEENGPPQPQMGGDPFTNEEIDQINEIEKIDRVEPVTTVNGKATIVSNDESHELSSLGTVTDSISEDAIETGSLPSQDEVLLTASFAQSISSEDTYESLVGETIQLFVNEMDDTNQPVTVERDLVVSGIYTQESAGPIAGAGAFVSYSTLEAAYNTQNLTLQPTQINAYAFDQDDVEGIKDDVEEAGFVSSPVSAMLDQVTLYLDMATWVLAGIAGISLLVSGIMILVVLYISVVERTREIGILRAIGARKKDIRRIFFTESALLGLVSGVIAVTGAYLISIGLNIFLADAFEVELIQLTPQYMLFGIGISTLISVIAGVLPSSKAAKLDPMESLRYE
ncbi:ATP-binding cassette domain-containing protein [Jeotgalibacillus proteolyticus]|uniref:ABC transporter ATP-binding protein/permease n=1 Tax=Jeotgalibacillus proteolyticus TaxID=2082395 RepID=UPI003CECB96B